ncbi:kelch repeat-containing protein [Rubrivirga sp. IMCC43871]|uniref:Kelch repeat-containing protein n=1 Tax=Rubrivirga sp. IMCC43871 TaxID=3391575 RepID=UPI00398FE5B3
MRLLPTILLLALVLPVASAQEAPAPRSGYAMAYDAAQGRVVLFGGSDSTYQRLGDTWAWTADGWRLVAGAGPPARSDAQMAFDAARGAVVLFGGRGADGALLGDTWVLDGAGWRQAEAPAPPVRQLAAMAYDAHRERVVLFGGVGADRARLGDTWEWDGRRWVEVTPVGGPPPRGAHGLAYDAARRQTVLVGGYGDRALDDTWSWDGTAWTRFEATGLPPRLHAAVAYDPSGARLLLFGGFGAEARESTLLAWDGVRWTALGGAPPAARAEHEGVYVPDVGFVVFGGVTGQGMDYDERVKTRDLWRFDGTDWQRLEGTSPAAPEPPIPGPTGPHPVGTRVVEWVDEAREERWTEARDRRRLQVQLWYPSAPEAAPTPAPYVPTLDPLHASLASYWDGGVRPLRFDVPGAGWEAPVAAGRFPLLVLSHGMNSPRFVLTGLALDLASRGFVVAAVDHTYWGPGVAFSDGTVVPYGAGMIARDSLAFDAIDGYLAEGLRVMSADQSFVARQVLAGALAGRIDEARVGVLGHSMGGMAADLTCLRDPLIAACLSLDGTLGAPVHVGLEPACSRTPFLLLASEQFGGALTDESTRVPQRLRAAWCDPVVLVLGGSRHNAFTDLPLLGAVSAGAIGAPEAGRVTREVAARFFERAFVGAPPDLGDVPGLRRIPLR